MALTNEIEALLVEFQQVPYLRRDLGYGLAGDPRCAHSYEQLYRDAISYRTLARKLRTAEKRLQAHRSPATEAKLAALKQERRALLQRLQRELPEFMRRWRAHKERETFERSKRRGSKAFKEMRGKTVARVEADSYGTSITIHFTDGSRAHFSPGTSGCHNEHWSTVGVALW